MAEEVPVIEVSRDIPAAPEDVFAVLADGWSMAGWVVGASHIRSVDPQWPAVGSMVHHSVGPWPASIDDDTEVTAVEPNVHLQLDARLWPVGAAKVDLRLTPMPGVGTRVTMTEALVRGPGRFVPDPLQALVLRPRNSESLRRLEDLAVGRAGSR